MMAIGERIRFFRNLRGMTQKYLGCLVGFPEKTADIRMAQYESGTRSPKADLTNKLAEVFGISPCNEIGKLKEMVKNAILDGEIENTFEAADAYMRLRAADLGLTAVK